MFCLEIQAQAPWLGSLGQVGFPEAALGDSLKKSSQKRPVRGLGKLDKAREVRHRWCLESLSDPRGRCCGARIASLRKSSREARQVSHWLRASEAGGF